MKKESSKDLQEKLIVYQVLRGQLEELTKQAGTLAEKMGELEMTEMSLKELEKSEADAEMLFPVGAGCYAYGRLSGQKDRFMVDIGAGLMADRTLAEALGIMAGKKKEAEDVAHKLQAEMEKLTSMINEIAGSLQEAANGGKPEKAAPKKEEKDEDDDDTVTVDE